MAERNTPTMRGEVIAVPLAAVAVEAGKIACANAAGYGVEGSEADDIIALGRFEASVDNSGGNAGDLSVEVRRGVFKFANSAGDAVDQTCLGKTVYIEDDQTVSKTDNAAARSAAGKCVKLDDDGVWVEIG